MAYAMTKQGSLDNCITYEFMCDTVADMNAIENRYRTIGTVAIVLQGESGMEVYIASSDKQWNALTSAGAGDGATTGGLSIYICGQNEVDNGLPDIDSPDETTIYLVSAGNTSGNLYEEYIYVDDAWEKFGAASIDLSNYIQKTDIATQSTAGLVKVLDNGNVTFNENNQLVLTLAGTAVVKTGQSDHPISVTHQHEAAFYGLAKAAGQDMKNSNNAVGTYTTEAASAIRTMIGAGTYNKPAGGIPAADLAETYLTQHQDISGLAPKASPIFTGSISLGRKANTTVGENSFAIGRTVEASGNYSHAEGNATIAEGTQSHAEGSGGTYINNGTTYTSAALGIADHTEGFQTRTADGMPGNHAEGFQTAATGGAAHAEGRATLASGLTSHAEGQNSQATGSQSHAEGSGCIASGTDSHAEGSVTQATDTSAHAEGNSTQATNFAAHAEGYCTLAKGIDTHAEGCYSKALGDQSHAEGYYTISKGKGSHVSGSYNVEDTLYDWPEWTASTSYEVGDKVKLTSETDVRGYICKVANSDNTFNYSHWTFDNRYHYAVIVGNGTAENARSNAYALGWDGTGHFAGDVYVGCNNDSTGGNKVAIVSQLPDMTLYATKANPEFTGTISLGRRANSTVGTNSVAIGNDVEASGQYSLAEGYNNAAKGICSHAEGNGTVAYDIGCHAEGYGSSANGSVSHAEGYLARARGNYSHAEGYDTIAGGQISHVQGMGTVATSAYMHVIGRYNVYETADKWVAGTSYAPGDSVIYNYALRKCKTANSDQIFDGDKWYVTTKYYLQVGNGTSDSNRSNAYSLTTNGDGRYNGDVYINCNADSTGGTSVSSLITRIAALETEIESLRRALLSYNVPNEAVTDEQFNQVTDESGNFITYDTLTN